MEANPKTEQSVSGQLFDALIKAAQQPTAKLAISFVATTKYYSEKADTVTELRQGLGYFSHVGILSFSDIVVDSDSKTITASILLLEPRFSNYMYAHSSRINDKNILRWLADSKYAEPINQQSLYTCRLVIKANTSDAYLQWDGGEEILYHFENMSSNRYILIKYLIQNPDMIHTLQQLKQDSVVPASTTRLHEYFSKTFVVGQLKDKFAITTEKERIGLKAVVQISGKDLVAIIRNNLTALHSGQKRHVLARFNRLNRQGLTDSLQLRKHIE